MRASVLDSDALDGEVLPSALDRDAEGAAGLPPVPTPCHAFQDGGGSDRPCSRGAEVVAGTCVAVASCEIWSPARSGTGVREEVLSKGTTDESEQLLRRMGRM